MKRSTQLRQVLQRCRFTLRSLLLVMLVAAGCLGWMEHRVRSNEAAFDWIEQRGGTVQDFSVPPQWIHQLLPERYAFAAVQFRDVDFAPEWCPVGREDTFVYERGSLTDSDLEFLAKLELTRLGLHDNDITDAGMVHLSQMKHLRSLCLSGTHITDSGVSHLRSLTYLESLSLADTDVTDSALVQLRGLTKLEHLNLSGTEITDNGMTVLGKFPQLKHLVLYDTEVSDEAIDDFADKFPTAFVEWSERDPPESETTSAVRQDDDTLPEPLDAAAQRKKFVQTLLQIESQLDGVEDEGPLVSLPTPEYWEKITK